MNDKDYIKIDDLFKGKPELEERIPAGAWNNMQDLLSKAATTGGGNGAGRYGTYALLALLTVGLGASAVTWQNMQSTTITTTETSMSGIIPAENQLAESNSTAAQASTRNTEYALPQNAKLGTSEIAAANNNASEPLAKENTLMATTSNNNSTSRRSTIVANNNQKINPSAPSKLDRSQKHYKKATKQSSAIANKQQNTAAQMLQSIQKQNIMTESVAPVTITAQTELALQNIDKAKYKPQHQNDQHLEAVVVDPSTNAKYVVAKNDSNWKKEVVDNVNFVKEKHTIIKDEQGVVKRIKDTVDNYTYTRTILAPLSQQDKTNLIALTSAMPVAMPIDMERANGLNDAALAVLEAGTATHVASSTLVPLETYKVKTIEKKASFASRFYDMMNNYLNGQQPFYFGGSLGIQNYFSTPMQTGFHLGLGGYYEFKERYTLGVELKYIQNQFGSQKINDSYHKFSNQTIDQSGSKPVYSATAQKFTDVYTLKSNSYWELPVTLRYQLSKLSVMGGVFANYMTGTKYSLQPQQMEGAATQVSASTQFKDEKPSVSPSDFKARMNMGLTLGASYDFSKHVSLDFRLNQNLWNNLKGTSALSENLYRATGAQLSLFYFIGKKDKVIYMMNAK